MEFNAVWSKAVLALEVIKESYAGNLHRNVYSLKSCRRSKHRIELRSCMGNAGRQRTAGPDTIRRRNLSNHGPPDTVGQHQVIVGVIGEHEFLQCGIQNPDRRFCRFHPLIVRKRTGRGKRPQTRNGSGG